MEEPRLTCQEISASLSEYLDEELPADVCREVDEHISGCAPCVALVESLKKTVATLREHAPEETPEPMREEARRNLLAAYRRFRGE